MKKAPTDVERVAEGGHGNTKPDPLRLRRLGIDTHQEAVIYMREDCHVCRSEGFAAHARIAVRFGNAELIATLHHVTGDLLAPGEAGLSEWAWKRLGATDGDQVALAHPSPIASLGAVRGKVYGHRLSAEHLRGIVADVAAGRFSDVELAAFITACAARDLDLDEIVALTGAMVEVGDRLAWTHRPVADKHCVGGLPGNRTTPIVVAIVAAMGVTIPKTSSRAITSPSGTADTMEVLAPVDLDLGAMRRVVEREGGCIVWGGAVRLSPADDVLIRVEQALDLDAEGQLVASVISKKVAAGATHLVLDIPVGPTAKVRGLANVESLSARLSATAEAFGIASRILVSDGGAPVGHGIGPALEACDVLAVVGNDAGAPVDLRVRAVSLAGALLELCGTVEVGTGEEVAEQTLHDGRACAKLEAICEAQGGMRAPPRAPQTHEVPAPQAGTVGSIDNRRMARVAKLAGAPHAKSAGVLLDTRIGSKVQAGEPMFTVHAESLGELDYALAYAQANTDIVQIIER